MSNSLETILIHTIAQTGPIDIAQFMQIALTHPQYGYYMKGDVFGREGDFTTAPEISQMFGEMIGVWLVDTWMKLGAPSEFNLVEVGPGRGTLMADILRATKNVKGFHAAAKIFLIEISTALKERQKESLKNYHVEWIYALHEVKNAAPFLIVGNEFLDALPIRQIQFYEGLWCERVISYNGEDFVFGLRDFSQQLAAQILNDYPSCRQGDIVEFSSAHLRWLETVCDALKNYNGAALLIDYGYIKNNFGDTLQALRRHEYVSVLEEIGNSDLTAHVNFSALKNVVEKSDMFSCYLTTQRNFLLNSGIEIRAQKLSENFPLKSQNVENDLRRLIGVNEMGDLFKVMGFGYKDGEKIELAGF